MIRSKSNKRYLYTKIDNCPQFLVMDKCNLCPFLINDFKGGHALCSKFEHPESICENKNHISVVSSYRHKKSSNQNFHILTQVDIPFWCELPDHLTKVTYNDEINYIKGGELVKESNHNYSNMIRLINMEFVKYDDDYETLISVYDVDSTKSTTPIKNTEVCSMCGEDKEDVDKNEHYGMCNGCWELYHDNDEKKKQAFINNFRMKRGKDFKLESYNLSPLKVVITK